MASKDENVAVEMVEMSEYSDGYDDVDGMASKSAQLRPSFVQDIQNGTVEGLRKLNQWLESIKEGIPGQVNTAVTMERKTALYIAVECINLEAVKALLEAKADVHFPNQNTTALHLACSLPKNENITDLVDFLIEKHPDCLTELDSSYKSPLHYAAENGHCKAVDNILKSVQKLEAPIDLTEFVNMKSKDNSSPLCSVAWSGSVEIAKLLVKNGARVTAPTERGSRSDISLQAELVQGSRNETRSSTTPRTPFEKAVFLGQFELASYFLEKGALISPRALHDAVSEGHEEIAGMIIQTPKWPVALRGTYKGTSGEEVTTPFRELIKKMPDIAEEVLNKCTVVDPTFEKEQGNELYKVIYNYEFIEDYKVDRGEATLEATYTAPSHESQVGTKTCGCGYKDILNRDRDLETKKRNDLDRVFPWGPVGFSKDNHPLAIMVKKKRLNLLSHPVVGSLLHHKWKSFGLLGYLLNLLIYCLFLASLTAFALVVPRPQDVVERNDSCLTDPNSRICGSSVERMYFLFFAAAFITFLVIIRLLMEIAQLMLLKLHYFLEWVNWMELTLYVLSLIFVFAYVSECHCYLVWKWQVGVVAVFLGWINLIIFVSKFPLTGSYVLMLVTIFSTFLKMVLLTGLLVIAFGLTFFMILYDPEVNRSPFANPFQSLLKTMAMTTGELDFNDMFRFDQTGPSTATDIAYPELSTILWVLFVILMPILLTNMLVGLAVRDIDSIEREAELQKLALQVDLVLTVESIILCPLRKWLRITKKKVKPNKRSSKNVKLFTFLDFFVWGGERYDNLKSINRALRPVVSIDTRVSEMKRDLSQLKQDVYDHHKEVKECMKTCQRDQKVDQKLSFLIEEIARKHDIPIPRDTTDSL